jgi:GNAT superfamily N-acetyltransferase
LIIPLDVARSYWAHPKSGVDPIDLPDYVEYWANGPVCVAFHPAPWGRVWMAHHAVMPEGRGRAVAPALEVLQAFWNERKPERIIGWTKESNRLACAFARRLGFTIDGRMDLPTGAVLMQGWANGH